MGVVLTEAFESLKARLDAEGKPLVIDRFLLAYIPGQDHTQAPPADQALPENVVHTTVIPPEYRAWVNPNQVVYSAFLGSDVGPFAFNWQGLYCSEYDTLCAVGTFPEVQKKSYDPDTNTPGNNITRNFLMSYDRAQGITHVTVEAAVWQLDFTVRLKGIDERERLSNRDIYGNAAFLGDAWLLTASVEGEGAEAVTGYSFAPGSAYVGGVRAALDAAIPVTPVSLPCDVWLDVSMPRSGSDVITECSPLFMDAGAWPDMYWQYQSAEPFRLWHYCAKVAHIDAQGNVTDLRKGYSVLPEDAKDGDVLTSEAGAWVPKKIPPQYETAEFYFFRHPTLRPLFAPAHGGVLSGAYQGFDITRYPIWQYLQTAEGQLLCKTETEWQAMSTAIWHTNADGIRVGWNGIGGAPFYVLNTGSGTLRLPDIRGMYAEAAGFDGLVAGGGHGDGTRRTTGNVFPGTQTNGYTSGSGVFYANTVSGVRTNGQDSANNCLRIYFDSARVTPTANKNQPRAWGALACVYLGPPAL